MAFWGTQRIRNLFIGDDGTRVLPNMFKNTVTSDTTAGPNTYTAAEIAGGMIQRDCNGDNRADVFPTAAAILALMPNTEIGAFIECTIQNFSNAAETITMTTATGLTLNGTMTIAQANSKTFRFVKTSSSTMTVYSMGAVAY